MNEWMRALALYRDPRILSVVCFGFSSGLPFLLTLATLHVWLAEAGTPKTIIGLFVLVTLPYTFKFLWAPMIDRLHVPLLSRVFGRRRGWILLCQIALIPALLALGLSNPHEHIGWTATAALCVAFFSAMQDIVIEAYRVEILPKDHTGPGAGASVLGYRLGMWVSGAGALYLASYFDWAMVYGFMAVCMVVGMIATILSPEPLNTGHPRGLSTLPFWRQVWTAVQFPITSLARRPDALTIIAFIVFYKIGDTILNVMSMPFLLESGFTKIQIAHVAKSFGIGAMILGGGIGGLLLAKRPLLETLFVCSLLQILSCFMFVIQALFGANVWLLFATIGIENLTTGLGSAAFITYLSFQCRAPHTATHFALLTSIGSFARVGLSSLAGYCADQVSWVSFYTLGALACVPLFFLLLRQETRFRAPNVASEGIEPSV